MSDLNDWTWKVAQQSAQIMNSPSDDQVCPVDQVPTPLTDFNSRMLLDPGILDVSDCETLAYEEMMTVPVFPALEEVWGAVFGKEFYEAQPKLKHK